MAVKDNNGLIYGIGKLKFNNKEIGWISQEGLSPKPNNNNHFINR